MKLKNTLHTTVLVGASLLPQHAFSAEEPAQKPKPATDEVLIERLGDDSYLVREKAQSLLLERVNQRAEAQKIFHHLPIIFSPQIAGLQGVLEETTKHVYCSTMETLRKGMQDSDLERAHRTEHIVEECIKKIDCSYADIPMWIFDIWIDELPQEHPNRKDIIDIYLQLAREKVGVGTRENYWKNYRYATKLYLDDLVREAYVTRQIPHAIRYLHVDRADMEIKGINDHGLRDVFQPICQQMLRRYVEAMDCKYRMTFLPSFPQDLVEKIRKEQGR
ncbi:hypothetical protein A3D11_01210 [Candidatus Peribacteria bacterium RIFCSPHIGHO2_02_FULL_49_16]|nr:MAG: hypothetical protein A2880_02335 [Candidatus Peribacteria bacterium RIFCSPHIGHO2_01_FULL_49_38]OGJ59567.1 MAG: hypothetical protein A3D11_01210 [Candidatus Peribacteria bacterium RIFCSPHIGHO2_02_FULL_49_16]